MFVRVAMVIGMLINASVPHVTQFVVRTCCVHAGAAACLSECVAAAAARRQWTTSAGVSRHSHISCPALAPGPDEPTLTDAWPETRRGRGQDASWAAVPDFALRPTGICRLNGLRGTSSGRFRRCHG